MIDTVTIVTKQGAVSVPVEPVNEWLCIAPTIGMDMDGGTRLGEFTLTHRASGMALGEAACIECCREAARDVAKLGLDWSGVTAETSREWSRNLPEDKRLAFGAALSTTSGCVVMHEDDWT